MTFIIQFSRFQSRLFLITQIMRIWRRKTFFLPLYLPRFLFLLWSMKYDELVLGLVLYVLQVSFSILVISTFSFCWLYCLLSCVQLKAIRLFCNILYHPLLSVIQGMNSNIWIFYIVKILSCVLNMFPIYMNCDLLPNYK